MDGWMDASGWMDGCMHACMHVCMHVCMYGPVSRVPESVSLGDHAIGVGGARDPESGLLYIYSIYMYIIYIAPNDGISMMEYNMI